MIITWHRLTHEQFRRIKKECHQRFLAGKKILFTDQSTALVIIAQICHSFNLKTECESKEMHLQMLCAIYKKNNNNKKTTKQASITINTSNTAVLV